jgi:hypothetical protein
VVRFTLTGSRNGKTVSITWEDGSLSGDADAVSAVQHVADVWEGRTIGQPGGPYTTQNHLASPYTARYFMCRVFSERPTLTEGALPLLPDPPEGAIR